MVTIKPDLVAAYERAYALTDYKVHDNLDKQYEFRYQTIFADKSLTKDEKLELIKLLKQRHDYNKINFNEGTRRTCEYCQKKCFATLYCEYCIRNYLKSKFSNWTSGNKDIDDLIQKCQMELIVPNKIIEWIPYNNLKNVKYLTKGGCSEIYTADWIDGHYKKWDSKEQLLKRYGTEKVILKKLENVKSSNRSWFDEAKSHLTISNKWTGIIQCYGLTYNPSNGNYMLVMYKMDIDLRKYLQQNHNQLTWKEKIKIIDDITRALLRIHQENAIHRDLHSGNILYSESNNYWYISDLGFCGPVDKPLECIYGNLPYVAPEVITRKEYTFASDIYSIAMLMWEISSGQPPFINYEHDYDLAMNIVNGMRPKIISGTPLKYKQLMEQCWDADPSKRPNINTFRKKIKVINKSYYYNRMNKSNKNMTNIVKNFLKNINLFQSSQQRTNINLEEDEISSQEINYTNSRLFTSKNLNLFQSIRQNTDNSLETDEVNSPEINYTNSRLFTSNIYKFKDLPEPKNATEGEQEAFHSKHYSFNIPESDIRNDFKRGSRMNHG